LKTPGFRGKGQRRLTKKSSENLLNLVGGFAQNIQGLMKGRGSIPPSHKGTGIQRGRGRSVEESRFSPGGEILLKTP